MIRWEYSTLFVGMRGNDHVVAGINGQVLDFQSNPQTPWDVLNRMGAEGWELVTAVPTSPFLTATAGHEAYWLFYLKRPVLASG